LALADFLVKESAQYCIEAGDNDGSPDLAGLSCRWDPLKSQNGVMLSLLVQGQDPNDMEIYSAVILQIQKAVGVSLGSLNPVQVTNMNLRWVPPSGTLEATTKSLRLFYPVIRLKIFLISLFVKFLVVTNIPAGKFRGDRYMRETSANADYKKFDDMLRLVLDCTNKQAEEIIAYLEQLRLSEKIFYGFQKSTSALMTCLVFSSDKDHVHFVDGADGGYALAAKVLKAQKQSLLKAAKTQL